MFRAYFVLIGTVVAMAGCEAQSEASLAGTTPIELHHRPSPQCAWDARPVGDCMESLTYSPLVGGGFSVRGFPNCSAVITEGWLLKNGPPSDEERLRIVALPLSKFPQVHDTFSLQLEPSGHASVIAPTRSTSPEHIEVLSCRVYPELAPDKPPPVRRRARHCELDNYTHMPLCEEE